MQAADRTASSGAPTSSARPIRVLVADDAPRLRDAICGLIAAEADMVVVGAAGDAATAIALASDTQPDIALLDVNMPGGGAHAAAAITRICPVTRIVALSACKDRASVLEMLRNGALGYVVKGT